MSVGTLAATLDPLAPFPYKQGREFVHRVVIAKTGNYATGGVTLDLTGLHTPGLSKPFEARVYSIVSPVNTYTYVPGTDRSDGKILGCAVGVQFTDDQAWPSDTIHATFRYKGSQ